MHFLVSSITNTYAYLAVMPFVSSIVVWFLIYLIYNDKKKATSVAIDVALLLLIGCIPAMSQLVFHSALIFWLFVVLLLIAGGLIGGAQMRTKGSIDYSKIYLLLSRLGFVVFSFLYCFLFVWGVVKYIHYGL